MDFNAEAEKILKQLQELLDKQDSEILSALPPICNQFLLFYNNYYKQGERTSKGLRAHQIQLQKLVNPDEQYSFYNGQRETESIRTYVTSLVNSARKLESLLTGFKSIFLKTLGQNFVQQIVIESEDYTPIIIQLDNKNFNDMENFIKTSLTDFEGKLKSNKQMLQFINNKNNNNLYNKIYIKDPYLNIYKETRRRLNIFYRKVKKGSLFGEGLLLYKPHQRWIKFYVTTLGDVKEGFASMVSAQAEITQNMQYDIQIFAEEYIGKVDNIAGTLIQDIQNVEENLQISIKSGSAQTGSHEELIKLIEKVASGNVDAIREAFIIDKNKSHSGFGQRNRIYSNKESKEKIATMIDKASKEKAKQTIEATILDLQKSNNVLVQIQRTI